MGLGHIILEEQDLTTRDRVQERLARFGWMFGGVSVDKNCLSSTKLSCSSRVKAENFDHLLSAGRLEASKLRLLAIEMDRRSRRYSQECGVEEEYPEDGGGEDVSQLNIFGNVWEIIFYCSLAGGRQTGGEFHTHTFKGARRESGHYTPAEEDGGAVKSPLKMPKTCLTFTH